MNEISDYEKKISQVDDEIMRMLKERLMLSEEEARLKKEKGLPVHDPVAERRKLEDITARAPEDMAVYTKLMYNTLNELTKDHQRKVVLEDTPLVKKIKKACETTPRVFPERALVACQGVQGAYQQQACDKLFSTPKILYTKNFNGVFAAIDQGLCQYGVLPLENSTAGSVNTIFDLMTKYNF
ncbi:MAG: prephenate dehydratase domain-containing protein, partial [Hornefia butyriciproducens]|nr:prephenate dehydratase domain-containing protein [Hornefia butyriciproducens]